MTFFVFVVIVVGTGAFLGFIALILKHQREMALINREGSGDARVDALEKRFAELTEVVHDQTLVLDNLNSRLSASQEVEERLRVGG